MEQGQAAQATDIDAVLLVVEQAAAEGGLGSVMEQDLGFLPGQGGLETDAIRFGGGGEIETQSGLVNDGHGARPCDLPEHRRWRAIA
jgi:hypothetical protein